MLSKKRLSRKNKKSLTITGVDPGTVNLAQTTSKFSEDKLEVLTTSKTAIIPPGKGKSCTFKQIFEAVLKWWHDHDGFPDSDEIWVEQQMKKKMILVSGIVLGLAGDRGRNLVPAVWRNYFGLSMGQYAANKRVSKSVCRAWLDTLPANVKEDDLAESYLIAAYAGRYHKFEAKDEWEIYTKIYPKPKK